MDVIPTRRDQYLQAITVRGDIDSATAGEFLLRLQALVGPASGPVLLDLSQTAFMNLAGLRALITLEQLVCSAGGSVQLVALSPAVARLIDLVTLHGDPTHRLFPLGFGTGTGAAASGGGSASCASAAV